MRVPEGWAAVNGGGRGRDPIDRSNRQRVIGTGDQAASIEMPVRNTRTPKRRNGLGSRRASAIARSVAAPERPMPIPESSRLPTGILCVQKHDASGSRTVIGVTRKTGIGHRAIYRRAIVSGTTGEAIVKTVDARKIARNRGKRAPIRGPRIAIRRIDRAIGGGLTIDRGTNPRKETALAVRRRGASKPTVPAAQKVPARGSGHASAARIKAKNETRTGNVARGPRGARGSGATTSSHGGPSCSVHSAI
jgi:hypothetical protein